MQLRDFTRKELGWNGLSQLPNLCVHVKSGLYREKDVDLGKHETKFFFTSFSVGVRLAFGSSSTATGISFRTSLDLSDDIREVYGGLHPKI